MLCSLERPWIANDDHTSWCLSMSKMVQIGFQKQMRIFVKIVPATKRYMYSLRPGYPMKLVSDSSRPSLERMLSRSTRELTQA